ncbi:hypothetical protein NUW58_g6858 [Xylaria curta]|uniref:Uncharacterized protein n=1 Tax=Xylaria curta TaxID=42375 RepID=A0ACC1NPD1_9PEZI|nr:hypothetical protein NUW58_g6858 [Xylaria curta]
MADLSRQSAFMPTIKCSNCGNQVEISMMGDHVCGGGNDSTASEPTPPMPDLLGGAFSSFKQNVFDKFSRVPPTVDTSAANQTFPRPDQLTPISASTGSQAISPKTPMNGRLGVGSNNDGYFSPAIAESPRRPSGYGGFSAEPEEGEAAYGTSPNKQTSSLLKRMNSIAPGPFEVARTRSQNNSLYRNGSRDETMDSSDRTSRLGSSIDRPGTSASISNTSGSIPLPKIPRKNGYGGFGPPQREREDKGQQPFALGKRSETFPDQLPKPEDNELQLDGPVRAPSAPGLRPDRSGTSLNENGDGSVMTGERKNRPSYSIRDTSRPPPPRKSLIRPPTRDGSQTLSINLADEFGSGNPYHSPSVSQSSSGSGFSRVSQASQPSSNTSPARSVGSRSRQRKLSDTSGMDAVMNDLQSSMNGLQPVASTVGPMPIPKSDSLRPGGPQREPVQNLRLEPGAQRGRDIRAESPISPRSIPNSERLEAPLPEGQSRMRSQTTSTQGFGFAQSTAITKPAAARKL